jgi:hypothetical protein
LQNRRTVQRLSKTISPLDILTGDTIRLRFIRRGDMFSDDSWKMPMAENPSSAQDSNAITDVERRELVRWQRQLLPFMKWFVILFGVVYFVVLLLDIWEMQRFLRELNSSHVSNQIFNQLEYAKDRDMNEQLQRRTDLLLVANAVHKANRQNSVAILSRIAARQSATFTGMVLSFIGAVFILGKLTDRPKDDLGAGGSQWLVHLSSASPGLILVVIGAILVGYAAYIQPSFPPDQSKLLIQLHNGHDSRIESQPVTPDESLPH